MILLEDRRIFWIVAALMVVLFAIANLPWQLDDYDQAKQAFTSFEMVKEGHWFYQHTPHERIATKPPLVAWISAALFAITRSWELAWGVPSLLSAMGLWVFLIGLYIWEKIRAQTPWTTRDRLAIFALLTGAVLIKGPIVYAFLLPGIA